MEVRSPFPDPEAVPLGAPVISLALQGGASLGAYTWGVLDALLSEPRLTIEGVTGASAGAINAAALAVGFGHGGRDGAKDALRAFWEGLAHKAEARVRGRGDLLSALWRNRGRLRSARAFQELTTRLAADFHIDPGTMEPLRSTLDETLDYSVLGKEGGITAFVNCTDISTGEPAVFSDAEITTDVICASAAVPLLFEPVVIGGRSYWDGGLIGNPAIFPVIYGCRAADVVLVETRNATTDKPVRSAADVLARTMELASIAGLVRELRTIRFVTQLIREHPRPGLREIRLHRIPGHPQLASLDGARAFRADVPYFRMLHGLGIEAGRRWVDRVFAGAPT